MQYFPEGIPMRDPFAMEFVRGAAGEIIPCWVVDLDRLEGIQFTAIAEAIAYGMKADPHEVAAEALAKGGFLIRAEWIASMECGAEGVARAIEYTEFLKTPIKATAIEDFRAFLEDQKRRWIDGDEIAPPLQTSIDGAPEEVISRERKKALEYLQAVQATSGISAVDIIFNPELAQALRPIAPDLDYLLPEDGDEEEY